MKTLLMSFAFLACLALTACDSGTGVSPDDGYNASRHGQTASTTDAANFCGESATQFDSETSAAERHQSGHNPDCFNYNEVEDAPPPPEPAPTELPKPDPRLD